jgi:hypothetical protein
MWSQPGLASLLRKIDADQHPISGSLACPIFALIPDLSFAMGTARGEDFSEGLWAFCEIRKSRSSLGIGICIALHRLDHLNFKRSPMG